MEVPFSNVLALYISLLRVGLAIMTVTCEVWTGDAALVAEFSGGVCFSVVENCSGVQEM